MPDDRDPFESTRMSLGEHLAELRKRLFRGVLALLIAFCVGWAYYDPFTTILLQPLKYAIDRVQADQLEKYEAKADRESRDAAHRVLHHRRSGRQASASGADRRVAPDRHGHRRRLLVLAASGDSSSR
jgi:hypothetical protein